MEIILFINIGVILGYAITHILVIRNLKNDIKELQRDNIKLSARLKIN